MKTTLDDLASNPWKFMENTVVITANKEVHYARDSADAYNSADRSGSEIIAEDYNVCSRDDVRDLIRSANND